VKEVLSKNILGLLGFLLLMPVCVFATTGTMVITTNTVLTEDHVGKIVINANGVTLNCKDYKVKGAGTGYGIDVVGYSGITITECHTGNFGVGFRLQNSSNSTLTKNSSTQNESTSGGFYVKNSHGGIMISKNNSFGNIRGRGFAVRDSSGVTLSKNTAHQNGFRGIDVGTSTDIFIEKNKVTNNGSAGIVLYSCSNITVEKNTTENSSYEGFALLNVRNSKFEKNNANNNNTYGFRVSGGSNNVFEKNTAYGNGSLDLNDSSCPNLANTWTSNLFNSANCPGIN